MKDIHEQNCVSGIVTIWEIDEATQVWTPKHVQKNLIMYTWGFIVAKAVGQGDVTYSIGGSYLEFYNVASAGNTVTVPTYGRGDGLSYYQSLASPGDYLRVPLASSPSITVQSGYESYFSAGQGNVMNFVVQTSGATGVLGRTFSDSVNSKVFGIALVATPKWSDSTKDVIFARAYFPTNQQQLKAAGSQIGVTWSIPLL